MNTLIKETAAEIVAANDSNWLGKLTVKRGMQDSVISTLVEQRKQWELGAYARSNDELYDLLTRCYQVYETMCSNTFFAPVMRMSLQEYMTANSITCNKNSHNLIKIVKCVFGTADARRVSTYSLALRAAAEAKINSKELKQFIKDKGGVQELRLCKQNAMKTADKAAQAKAALAGTTAGEVSSSTLMQQVDMSNAGELVVLIATQQANGTFALHAAVTNASVVNVALAAYYSRNKHVISNNNATAEAISTEDALRAHVAAPVQQ
jgi:hypothetical protein